MKKTILPFLLLLSINALAQDLSFGFKAGLNYSRFSGPFETNDAGDNIESFKTNTGFHVGAGFSYGFTDFFGVKAELIYSQKGGRIRIETPSYFWLENASGDRLLVNGNRFMSTNIYNSYLDIPIMGYAKLGPLEFGLGVNAAFLVASTAGGEIRISDGKLQNGTPVENFSVSLDYNYFSNEAGEAFFGIPKELTVGLQTITLPNSLGAYYDFEEKKNSLFNTLDLGLNAEVNLFVNEALYLGFRFNYGLLDVTNEKYDRAYSKLNNDETFILRNDFDRNVTLQTSIGFSF